MFPGARIIHTQRDPLDTCLSCYFHDFAGHYPYTYDLRNLGRYHRLYDQLMAHWSAVLGDRLIAVKYETLVDDQEAQTRRLLDFCGLEWDDRCLEFHQTDRVVLTASRDQVRRPMYRSSVGKAQRYEAHLAPLREVLTSP